MSENDTEAPAEQEQKRPAEKNKPNLRSKKILTVIVAILILGLLIPSAYLGYTYAVTPEPVRKPTFEHLHFRMQVIVDGKEENFGDAKYQQEYSKDLCTADLTESPIHFHDNKNQFVHIHWNDMTGGMVMKYYGWNHIGGSDGTLGYRMDSLPVPKAVPIKGDMLPNVPEGYNYYVYVGDEKGYTEKNFDDWKSQNLEDFFGKKSSVPDAGSLETSFLDRLLFPAASAHGGHDHGDESEAEKLTRINNLLGNVVIFAQKDKPTDEQIKERFNNLVELTESTCGG